MEFGTVHVAPSVEELEKNLFDTHLLEVDDVPFYAAAELPWPELHRRLRELRRRGYGPGEIRVCLVFVKDGVVFIVEFAAHACECGRKIWEPYTIGHIPIEGGEGLKRMVKELCSSLTRIGALLFPRRRPTSPHKAYRVVWEGGV